MGMTTGEYDPIYAMLRYLTKDMDQESRTWYAFVYVAHYNIASGTQVFTKFPTQVRKFDRQYDIGKFRRNLRAGKWEMDWHLDSLWRRRRYYGSLSAWIESALEDCEDKNFYAVMKICKELHGNGRWAMHKTAEVLSHVGYPIHPCDMGNALSSAPRAGLGLLYHDPGGNSREVIAYLDACGEHLRDILSAEGVPGPMTGGVLSVAEVESTLCDFHSTWKGRFYCGKCADAVLSTMNKVTGSFMEPVWAARSDLFDHRVLGEYNGWTGIDAPRCAWYKRTGKLPWRWERTLLDKEPPNVSPKGRPVYRVV